MTSQPEGQSVVYSTANRAECLEAKLVLDAIGLNNWVLQEDREWHLAVDRSDADRANSELDGYLSESHAGPPIARVATVEASVWPLVAVYSATLLLVALMNAASMFGRDWLSRGQMDAQAFRDGQWWRCVTALTLHVDPGHLLGNLVFGGFFGMFVARIHGVGRTAGLMLLGGALGNAINAAFRPGDHLSIGASTAVFACLGLLVADALRPRDDQQGDGSRERSLLRRWSPIIGGVALFGLLGVGDQRTDLGAHATGMLGGFVLAWPVRVIRLALRQHRGVQTAWAVVASASLVIAWTAALLEQS